MIPAFETFDGTFPFAPRFSNAPGFQMHYVDEGQGEALVMLHGEPTWGYLYRHLIPPLARRFQVIVPDHMGFGKSETPQDREYTLATHVANLEALLLELDLHDITLVMQDWGGAVGAGFALRHPERVKRLFLMNTVVPLGLPIEAALLPRNNVESDWFRWARAAHENGTLAEVLGNAGHAVTHLMKELQGVRAELDGPVLRAYAAHFQTRADCLGAISFPLDILTGRNLSFRPGTPERVAALRAKPAMLAYGMQDRALLPQYFIPIFQAQWPGAPVIELPRAGHFVQEDAPDTLTALIEAFVHFTA